VRLDKRRVAVSELYAAILLIGVTLSFGGVVAVSAMNQFNAGTSASSQGLMAQAASAGKEIALVYGVVPSPGSGGCTTTYGGLLEGTGYTLAIYDFGTTSFTPAEIFDNGTLLSGTPYPTATPGSLTTYSLTLGCAHAPGQVFLLVDSSGTVIQLGT
jgi:hypothetical protein